MGTVVELFLVMTVIAGVVFAPLGYFIYMYTKKHGEPFGETQPHGDVESPVIIAVEKAIAKIKSFI